MKNEKVFAFVLMPFNKDFDDIYNLGIKEAAKSLGIRAERVDEQIYEETILNQIYNQIDNADIIIADMSNLNPNVFYEVGYAHAKKKLTILLANKSDEIPFDLKHHRHIIYNNSIQNLKQELLKDLEWAKQKILSYKATCLDIDVRGISGDLVKTNFSAQGVVNFEIDILNNDSNRSTEIRSITFYSTKDWEIFQQNKLIPNRKSDIKSFDKAHKLNFQNTLLSSGDWLRLEFTAKKYFERFTNKEIKDSYTVNGWAILRIKTDKGDIDNEIDINVDCCDVPF